MSARVTYQPETERQEKNRVPRKGGHVVIVLFSSFIILEEHERTEGESDPLLYSHLLERTKSAAQVGVHRVKRANPQLFTLGSRKPVSWLR